MTELETLIVARAAAMAQSDGVGVQIVHVFGATNQISAELATARDRLIAHPGLIADVLDAQLSSAEEGEAPEVAPEVSRLVIAARIVAYEDQSAEALEELDKASEAFAELVPWDNEPVAPDGDGSSAGTSGENAEAGNADQSGGTGDIGQDPAQNEHSTAPEADPSAQEDAPVEDGATSQAKTPAASGRAKLKAK